MKHYVFGILTDESGKPSATRCSALLWTLIAILVVFVGMIMLAYGVAGVTPFVGMVLGGSGVKSASDLWAAQTKSAKITVGTRQTSNATAAQQAATRPLTDKTPGGVQ